MKTEEFYFKNKRGSSIYSVCYCTETKTEGTVISMHGYLGNQQTLEYFDLITNFHKKNLNICGFDLEGHGKSGGVDYEVHTLNDYKNDFRMFVDHLKEKGMFIEPVFLMGYSLGGNLAFNLAVDPDFKDMFKGVVLISPFLGLSKALYVTRLVMERPLRIIRVLFPRTPIFDILKNFEKIMSNDPKGMDIIRKLKEVKRDNFISANSSINLLQLTDRNFEKARDFDLPLLLLHGSKDTVTCWESSKSIAKNIKSKTKYFVNFNEENHLFPLTNKNETERFILKFICNLANL